MPRDFFAASAFPRSSRCIDEVPRALLCLRSAAVRSVQVCVRFSRATKNARRTLPSTRDLSASIVKAFWHQAPERQSARDIRERSARL